ncbi:Crp/Fnr family transcriptional regulator [Algoriphagus confluentis]|uniref:Crp/Fnr family transcriptional regulator n=1 Tax=Algoriphagus confluentis TaxID=1697556 RepID=A0ABQ6PUR6_9BACT|nr:Crp/Fnr family transcriptional regulator [Algoriphagus confluentis]
MWDRFKAAILELIKAEDEELEELFSKCYSQTFQKYEPLSLPGKIPQDVFFIAKGILRVIVTDSKGTEHTVHFATENQFVADYSSFLLNQPGIYTLQALEPMEVVVMPRKAINWGYEHMKEGDKFGRKVAEFYFVYQDNRVKNTYSRTAKERYEMMESIFPQIHQRVPQHMIASYLGITPVHLSRLKKER